MEPDALTVADATALGYVALIILGIFCIYQILEIISTLLYIWASKNENKNIKEAKQTLEDSVVMLIVGGIVCFLLYS